MPLIKGPSKKAFKENVETEMKAHPGHRAQNLAIAYAVQKKAKGKKMSHGGEVHEFEHKEMPEKLAHGGEPKLGTGKRFSNLEHSLAHEKGIHDPGAVAAAIGRKKYGDKGMGKLSHHEKLAHGGEVEDIEDMHEEYHPQSIAEHIMHAKKMKQFADGGMVDIDDNEQEDFNHYDDLNEAALKENYDDTMEGLDEGHEGPSPELEDEDEHDMVSKIRSKMKMRK